MKRNLLLILSFALCLGCMAQTTIQMEEYNGVYRIPCTVNGAKMKFIFDTGASQVCLSMTMAEYLLDNDFITADDIIGNGSTTVADGRIVNHVKINIRDLEIQGNHLYNVPAMVIEGQNAPLLMGQSAIQKLGAIVINGNTMIIQNGNASGDDEYFNRLVEEADEAFDNGLNERAAEKYRQAYESGYLTDYGKYLYAQACYFSEGERMEQYGKSEAILNTITDFKYFEEKEIDIYGFIGRIKFGLNKREEAINYYKLSNKKMQNHPKTIAENLMFIGDCYYFKDDYLRAIENYESGIARLAKINGVSTDYIWRDAKNQLNKGDKSLRTGSLDCSMFFLCECYKETLQWSKEYYIAQIKALARAKNEVAINNCKYYGISLY